jgi:hypothetical protein
MKKLTIIIAMGLIFAFTITPFSLAATYVQGTVYRVEQDANGTYVQIQRASDDKVIGYYIASSADENKALALLLTAQVQGDTVIAWPSGGVWTKFRIQY